MKVVAYGEAATFVDLESDSAVDRAARTQALGAALRARWPSADIVLGAGSLAVIGVAPDAVRRVADVASMAAPAPGRRHTVSAIYDGEDLHEVANGLGVSAGEVIARHTEPDYAVELVGFMPGFAYLSAPAFRLEIPRRASPRPRVPAGAVGLAASFTGIYPFASPGGWSLIARVVSSAVLFEPARDPPALFAPGDRVRFVPVRDGPPEVPGRPARPAAPRGLLVTAAPACATVQDGGRRGQLARGIAPAGPLDPETFAAANAAVGNPPGTAAVEIPLGTLEIEARGVSTVVSVDGEPARLLAASERLRVVECDRAVRYLAVRGGIDVPLVLGARATLLAARTGGYLGRTLRRGDVLPTSAAPIPSPTSSQDRRSDPGLGEVLLVDPGPHIERFPQGAYEALLAGPWRVSAHGDRVGVRLQGARVPREGPDLAAPAPMIRGAIEITSDGTPIVLGPDHPTTGGYPVLAVVRALSLPALARRRPGAAVRLVDARMPPARDDGCSQLQAPR